MSFPHSPVIFNSAASQLSRKSCKLLPVILMLIRYPTALISLSTSSVLNCSYMNQRACRPLSNSFADSSSFSFSVILRLKSWGAMWSIETLIL